MVRRTEASATARQVALVAILGLVFATSVLAGWFNRSFLLPDPATHRSGWTVSGAYDPPDEVVELYLNQGDGQLFAHQAQDPFVRRPEGIRGGPEEQAYRLQRPLYGWIGWVASGGRPSAVAWALVAVTLLSVGLLAAVAARACAALGASPLLGAVVLAAPGVAVDLIRCGPEVLATALVAMGLLAWLAPVRRTWVAVACFAAACLARETILLVPLTLVAVDAWERRAPGERPTAMARRLCSPLLLSAVPFIAWVLVLRVGLGAWPRGSVEGRLSFVPFAGLWEVASGQDLEELVAIALLLVPAVVALVLGRHLALRALVAAHLALAAVLGPAVWVSWLDFGRVLLPLSLVTLLALVHAGARPSLRPAERPSRPVATSLVDPGGG